MKKLLLALTITIVALAASQAQAKTYWHSNLCYVEAWKPIGYPESGSYEINGDVGCTLDSSTNIGLQVCPQKLSGSTWVSAGSCKSANENLGPYPLPNGFSLGGGYPGVSGTLYRTVSVGCFPVWGGCDYGLEASNSFRF